MTSLDAKRAGRALFQATQPHGAARATLDSLEQFAALLGEHADLRDALMSVVRACRPEDGRHHAGRRAAGHARRRPGRRC